MARDDVRRSRCICYACDCLLERQLVEATILVPSQLFKAHYGLTKGRRVFLVEGHHYFRYDTRNLLFHKKNLCSTGPQCAFFADRLKGQDYSACYVQLQGSPGRNPLFDIL